MFYTTTQILPRKGEKKRKRSCIIVYNLIAKGVPKKMENAICMWQFPGS